MVTGHMPINCAKYVYGRVAVGIVHGGRSVGSKSKGAFRINRRGAPIQSCRCRPR